MKTVTTIHLNGRAYQVEDEAHKALAAYLEQAGNALSDNPDKDEILADFEQAIAEKFAKYLSANKNVITHKEIETIIAEMGPVNGAGTEGEKNTGDENGSQDAKMENGAAGTPAAPKRLYRIKEGAMLAGVCNGLAAYFNIDVVIVRIAFVLVTLISHGLGILAYLVMMLIIPTAGTQEERAHAQGVPFTAYDFIEQAKKNYAEFKNDEQGWKKQWREQKKYWKYTAHQTVNDTMYSYAHHHGRNRRRPERPVHDTGNQLVSMLLGIVTAAVTVVWIVAVVMLCKSGAVFGVALPATMPLWVGIVILIALYNIVIWPLRMARYPHFYREDYYDARDNHGWFGIWEAAMWMGLIAVLTWVLYRKVPEARYLLNMLGHWTNVHIIERFHLR